MKSSGLKLNRERNGEWVVTDEYTGEIKYSSKTFRKSCQFIFDTVELIKMAIYFGEN